MKDVNQCRKERNIEKLRIYQQVAEKREMKVSWPLEMILSHNERWYHKTDSFLSSLWTLKYP